MLKAETSVVSDILSVPQTPSNLAHLIKFSRGEICVGNFIPPVNGASQGNYVLPKM